MTVAGSDLGGSPLRLTADLPVGWKNITWGAVRGDSAPPAGMAFIVSLVDDTFTDPCTQLRRTPKIGPTVEALMTALGEIPDTTATKPVKTTLAGHEATSIEIAIPGSLPCAPDHFYLWQDSPGEDWWVQGLNERIHVWVLEVGGRRVAIATHSYAGSGPAAEAELQKILDSMVFDVAS